MYTVTVAKGDVIEIVVGTADSAAADVEFYASFAGDSEENPVMLNPEWNDAGNKGTVTVTVPANSTIYVGGRFGGMLVSINGSTPELIEGGEFFAPPAVFEVTNDTDEAVEYVLVFSYPAGTMENPEKITVGENTAVIGADSLGYYYTFTAEADGVVTLTMPAGDWSYTINNMTTYVYGETQWSDSDPVINPETVEVKAGDELQIIINTYDPNSWNTPAGEITFTFAVAYNG